MTAPPLYVGLDVGGSAMKAGVVDDTGKPLSSVSLPTEAHRGQEFGLARMAETIRAAINAAGLTLQHIDAIGVDTPGFMDLQAGIIVDPPNLKPWKNVPVRQYIADTFRLPTAFQNDGNAAALGEYWVGAGRDARSIVLFTLGTGIGGGIILDGKVLEGRHGLGAELGHIIIEMSHPRQCGCGRFGCLEAYASATAIVQRAREALAADPGASVLHRANELSARAVFNAASQHDSLAMRLVEETARYLAVGTVSVMHTIDPDMVVYGGGMTAAGLPFLKAVRAHVAKLAFDVLVDKTEIRYAELGPDAGFIGAAACARQLLQART